MSKFYTKRLLILVWPVFLLKHWSYLNEQCFGKNITCTNTRSISLPKLKLNTHPEAEVIRAHHFSVYLFFLNFPIGLIYETKSGVSFIILFLHFGATIWYKKVLLRERKRHTAHRAASTRYAVPVASSRSGRGGGHPSDAGGKHVLKFWWELWNSWLKFNKCDKGAQ